MTVLPKHSIPRTPYLLTPQPEKLDHPLFIFLPGMDGTGHLLRSQLRSPTASLQSSFDIRCLSIPLDDLTSWEVLTQRVVELVQAELTKSPRRSVYLCGESFGGCLAMYVALHSPWLFERIILVNPASSFSSRPWMGWAGQFGRWLPEPLFQLSSATFLSLLGNLSRIAASDRHAFHAAVQSVPQETTLWRLSLLNQFQLADTQLRRLTQPVLLLASGSDRLLPSLEEAHRLAGIFPHAKVVALPDSGHACLLEAEVNLYQIMEAHHFLSPHFSDPHFSDPHCLNPQPSSTRPATPYSSTRRS